jgi:Tfp pilus assembly protein PilE
VIIAALIIPIIFVGGILAAIALPAYQQYQQRAAQKMQQPQR